MNRAPDSNYTGDVTLIPGRKNHRTLTVALPNIWLRMLECISKLCLEKLATGASLFTSLTAVCLYKPSLPSRSWNQEREKAQKSSPTIETKSPAKLSRVSIRTEVFKVRARHWQPRSVCLLPVPLGVTVACGARAWESEKILWRTSDSRAKVCWQNIDTARPETTSRKLCVSAICNFCQKVQFKQ